MLQDKPDNTEWTKVFHPPHGFVSPSYYKKMLSTRRIILIPQLVLPLIPITALVIQNGVTMNTLMSYSSR